MTTAPTGLLLICAVLISGASRAATIPVEISTALDNTRAVEVVATPKSGVGPSASTRLTPTSVTSRSAAYNRAKDVYDAGGVVFAHAARGNGGSWTYPVVATLQLRSTNPKVPGAKAVRQLGYIVWSGTDVREGVNGRAVLQGGGFTTSIDVLSGEAATNAARKVKFVLGSMDVGADVSKYRGAGNDDAEFWGVQVDAGAIDTVAERVDLEIGDSADATAPKVRTRALSLVMDDVQLLSAGKLDFGDAEPRGAEYLLRADFVGADGLVVGQTESIPVKAKAQKKGAILTYDAWNFASNVSTVIGTTYATTFLLRFADNADASRNRLVSYDFTPLDGAPAIDPSLLQGPMSVEKAGTIAVSAASEMKPGYTWMFWVKPIGAGGKPIGDARLVTATVAACGAPAKAGGKGTVTVRANLDCENVLSAKLVSLTASYTDTTVAIAGDKVAAGGVPQWGLTGLESFELAVVPEKSTGPALITGCATKECVATLRVPLKTIRSTPLARPTVFGSKASVAGLASSKLLKDGDRFAFRVRLKNAGPNATGCEHGSYFGQDCSRLFVVKDVKELADILKSEYGIEKAVAGGDLGAIADGDVLEFTVARIESRAGGTVVRLKARYKPPCDLSEDRGICLRTGPGGTTTPPAITLDAAWDPQEKTLELGGLLAGSAAPGLAFEPITTGYDAVLAPDVPGAAAPVDTIADSTRFSGLVTIRYPTGTTMNDDFAYRVRFTPTANFVDDWQGETADMTLQKNGGGTCLRGKCFCVAGWEGSSCERRGGAEGNFTGASSVLAPTFFRVGQRSEIVLGTRNEEYTVGAGNDW